MNYRNTWHNFRYETTHMFRLRRRLLCAELTCRHIPHSHGGDAVSILIDGLWFDVFAWLHQDDGTWEWVIDHPHADPDDEHPGLEICRTSGFRFRTSEIRAHWDRYTQPA